MNTPAVGPARGLRGSARGRRIAPLLAGLVIAAGGFAPRAALARSIAIDDFDVSIDVAASGALEVTETIRLRFDGAWNGIHRLIPVEYRTPRGDRFFLRFSLAGVTTDTGERLRVQRSREGHAEDLKIFIPNAADAVRTIVIRYTVRHGLRFFPDHDELYWNVTGDEWPYPIRTARVRVTLPRSLVNVRANAFTGAFGSTERAATIRIDGERHAPADAFDPAVESPPPAGDRHVVEVEADRALGIREGLTIAIAWNPGVIHRPDALERWLAWVADNLLALSFQGLLVLVPLVTGAVLLRRWLKKGRDPATGPVVVQYEPPAGLGPAEVGTLVDNTPDTRDLMAMLVDLAVRGVIRIRETSPAGWLSRPEYAFDLLGVPAGAAGLPESEQRLIAGLFPGAGTPSAVAAERGTALRTVTCDDLRDRFHTHLPGIRSAIFDRLVADDHYRERPDRVVSGYVGAAIGAGVLFVVVLGVVRVLAPALVSGAGLALAIASGIVTVAAIGGFGAAMPARTKRGADTRAAIRGFEEFLSRVESHRLASLPLTPDLFERYLPYAMALGVEGRWAKAFEGICTEPPQWYVGSSPIRTFHAANLTGDLSRMSAVTATAMQSAPRSSGGSGFGSGGGFSGGGGGFSGGGFGGGGGRGF